MKKFNILTFIFILLMTLSFGKINVNAEEKFITDPFTEGLEEVIEDLINWKKVETGVTKDDYLLNNNFLANAGTTAGDWYPVGLGRYNYEDDYNAYLAVINKYVNDKYNTKNKLHRVKATEWHRISLAITAMGGDPTHIIDTDDGSVIDLIADGTYNRGKTLFGNRPADVGAQGINGWIFGLITLDSRRYEVPEDADKTRFDFIKQILRCQLPDGGFALSGQVSDVDITAMAVQALSNYYNSEYVYEYETAFQKDEDGNPLVFNKTVKQVIDECLNWISSVQTDKGHFQSFGTTNVESICQVLVALNSLNIDYRKDQRFIKNGINLLDAILTYRMEDGGFIHSLIYDPDNPTSLPDKSNTMSGEQVLYTLVSIYRQEHKMRALYDMLDEFTIEEVDLIDKVVSMIDTLNETSTSDNVKEVMNEFYKIPVNNRRYISNYWNLSKYLHKFNLPLPKEDVIFSGSQSDSHQVILYFTETNRSDLLALPKIEELTTEQFVKVANLKYILDNCEEFPERQEYLIIIEKAQNQIDAIQKEIDALDKAIIEELNPISKVGLNSKNIINSLYERYNALSEYDQAKITHLEDLNKANAKVNTITTIIIASSVTVIVVIASVIFIRLNVLKRRKAKQAKLMPESDE